MHLKVIGQLEKLLKKHITNKNITNNIMEKIHMCISGMKIKNKNKDYILKKQKNEMPPPKD